MDFPITALLDEGACYHRLVTLLHPAGLACPRRGRRGGRGVHRRHRAAVLDYHCPTCGRVFNAFTGTPPQQVHRPRAFLVLVLRGTCRGVPTARLARELGRDRGQLLGPRHRMQAPAERAAGGQAPLPDAAVEADETYQDAGEKRPAPRPG